MGPTRQDRQAFADKFIELEIDFQECIRTHAAPLAVLRRAGRLIYDAAQAGFYLGHGAHHIAQRFDPAKEAWEGPKYWAEFFLDVAEGYDLEMRTPDGALIPVRCGCIDLRQPSTAGQAIFSLVLRHCAVSFEPPPPHYDDFPETEEETPPPNTTGLFSPLQSEIWAALDGKAMTKKQLADEVCGGDGSRLYKKDGLKEMRAAKSVAHQRPMGYYRPDAPPVELVKPKNQNAPN